MSSKELKPRERKLFANSLIAASALVLGVGLVILAATFYPVFKHETQYALRQIKNTPVEEIVPVNTEFGIVIPKIGANSRVVANVDPYNSQLYQRALSQGVAHAAGTVLPGEIGNSFLFSHSSVDFFEARRFNSIFYLLNKLEIGDEIDIYLQDEKLVFLVTATGIHNPQEINFLKPGGSGQTLTLMTCWPPGTTFKRLIVTASLQP
jgi:sortase A